MRTCGVLDDQPHHTVLALHSHVRLMSKAENLGGHRHPVARPAETTGSPELRECPGLRTYAVQPGRVPPSQRRLVREAASRRRQLLPRPLPLTSQSLTYV